MTYPTTPDTTIKAGDHVRSYDFPGDMTHYVEGTIVAIVQRDGRTMYQIAQERRVYGPYDADVKAAIVYAPVNGTEEGFIGLCRGVVRVPTFASRAAALVHRAQAASEFTLSRAEQEEALQPLVTELRSIPVTAAMEYIRESVKAGTPGSLALAMFKRI